MADDEQQELIDQIVADHDAIFRAIRAEWSKEMLAADLTLPQLRLLFLLDHSGTLSMSHLARALGRTLPTVTGLVDRLVEHGVVQRSSHAEDRRVTIVSLSEAGHEVFENFLTANLAHMRRLVVGLNDEELRLVAAALRTLRRQALSQETATPTAGAIAG